MFVLGLMGEYIARLYNQSKNRPLYVVSDIAGEAHSVPTLGIVAQTRPFPAPAPSPASAPAPAPLKNSPPKADDPA